MSVTRHQIERGEIVAEVMGTGTLEARVKTTVSPKISGRVAEVVVDQGDRVQSGQLLVRLDDEELRQQVAIAEASRETAEAAVVRLTTDKERATAVFEQAKTNYNRVESLFAKTVSSREELEARPRPSPWRRQGPLTPKPPSPRAGRNLSPPRRRSNITGRDWPTP